MGEIIALSFMDEHLKNLKHIVGFNQDYDVSTVLKNAEKYIQTEYTRKEFSRRTYIADASELTYEITNRKYKSIDELHDSMISTVGAVIEYAKNNSVKDFVEIEVTDEASVYGIHKEMESVQDFERRLGKLERAQCAIDEIRKILNNDMFEIELAELRKKYNKD